MNSNAETRYCDMISVSIVMLSLSTQGEPQPVYKNCLLLDVMYLVHVPLSLSQLCVHFVRQQQN